MISNGIHLNFAAKLSNKVGPAHSVIWRPMFGVVPVRIGPGAGPSDRTRDQDFRRTQNSQPCKAENKGNLRINFA